jgi:mono/diheme cytochrome c family protein
VIRRILVGLLVVILVVVAAIAFYVASRQNLRFDSTPYPEIAASTDSAVIERGRYLVRDLVVCTACHGDPKNPRSTKAGADIALTGGRRWDIPPGTFYSRNITPDSATGIGGFEDRAIARALRNGVGHDGRALLPFMEVQGLSDDDLTAVISYLRSQAPVHNVVPAHRYNLLGKVVKATVLANPVGPKHAPPRVSPRGATVENGAYLVESVALCGGCHTQRDMATGQFTGPPFGGGTGMVESEDPTTSWSPPNLTSDPATGRLGIMSEDAFVARIRAGRAYPGSPMPWEGYGRLAEDDLRAIYRFLKTVPAVKRDVGPAFVPVKKSG